MSEINKVFGIISYFPDNDTAYHIETRRERSRRCSELLLTLSKLWPTVDVMIIAQNWQDYEPPKIENRLSIRHYGKLGILGARRELRKQFLLSEYDYLIMLDDDGMIKTENPHWYLAEIDNHPDGVGVIRHTQCPLMLLAVSRYVYSHIDMPDIDAEKGEGFEDDVFVATCFATFPDRAFDFPKDCVTETSFKYLGVGKCPSSWARESKRNWSEMLANTHAKINAIEHQATQQSETPEIIENPTIDVIISYVNASDSTWLRSFEATTKTHNPSQVRYRSWGTLKYIFRGIENYMPFVRNIILVLSGPTQVPAWLDTTKVRIVYHEEFIPSEYLPTFNSCTIEAFFGNIQNLSDRVIYLNDDIFPINPLHESDFFTDMIPHIRFTEPEAYSSKAMFRQQCRSGMDMITKVLNLPTFQPGKIIRPYHISAALLRDTMVKVSELCKTDIANSISCTRTLKNVNQYIYSYYQYFTGDYINTTVYYKYLMISDKTIDEILAEITTGGYQMLCLNDSDKLQDYARVRYRLQVAFDKKFPNPSSYER